MFLRRKLTVMTTIALLSSSLLAGCGSSEKNTTGSATAKEVLANENARAAIAMAINKQDYCDVILNNGSIPADTYTFLLCCILALSHR